MREKVVFVPVYIDKWTGLTEALPEAERNKLIGAFLDYAIFHKEPKNLTKTSKILFQFLKPVADDLNKDKGGAPEGNQNAKKKQPVETTSEQPVDLKTEQQVETTENNLLLLKARNQKLNKERESQRESAAPTLDECRKFAEERSLDVNPDRFFKYYKARGWKIKGDLITDWQALMESWTTPDGKPIAKQPAVKPVKAMISCPACGSLKTETRLDHAICGKCGKGFNWDFTEGGWAEDMA